MMDDELGSEAEPQLATGNDACLRCFDDGTEQHIEVAEHDRSSRQQQELHGKKFLPKAAVGGTVEGDVREWMDTHGVVVEAWVPILTALRAAELNTSEWVLTLQRLASAEIPAFVRSAQDSFAALAEKLLREYPLLASIPEPAFIPFLAQRMKSCVVPAGSLVICVDDPSDEMFFILSGEVEVRVGSVAPAQAGQTVGKAMAADSRSRVVAVLGPGARFGESALLSNKARSASVVAVTDDPLERQQPSNGHSVELAVLSREALDSAAARFPAVEQALHRQVAASVDLLKMNLQQWLNERDMGSYTSAIVHAFEEAGYEPREWLAELEDMSRPGPDGVAPPLHRFARAVRKHYTSKGDKITRTQRAFLASASAKLAAVPLLAAVSQNDELMAELRDQLQMLTLPNGAMVIRKGVAPAEHEMCMYFILDGSVRVLDEFDAPPLATLGPGDFFGEASLISNAPRNAHVQVHSADGDDGGRGGVCELCTLSKRGLSTVLSRYPGSLAEAIFKPTAS
jgi:CRP-like cAMP-binding protein